MTRSKAEAGFHIGVTCPGCGGELELQTDFFSLECSHCGSVLRIKMPDKPPAFILPALKQKREIRFQVDRYLKSNGLPLTQSGFSPRKIYYPYWKLDAIRLKVGQQKSASAVGKSNFMTTQIDYGGMFQYGRALGNSLTSGGTTEVKTKVKLTPFTSTVAAGPSMPFIPASIGLRTDYVKALPFAESLADESFECLPVAVPWDQIKSDADKSVAHKASLNAGSGGKTHSRLFNSTGSLVYFPYYIVESEIIEGSIRLTVDGLSGRVVHADQKPEETDFADSPSVAAGEWGELKVDFHRCSNCGVDLPANRSCIYICHNCHVVTLLDSNLVLHDGIMCANIGSNDQQFPFWLLSVSPVLLMQAGIAPAGNKPPPNIAVPAFEIRNFDAMRRLCRRMTLAVPDISLTPVDKHDKQFLPVTVGLRQAVTLAEIILHTAMLGKSRPLTAATIELSPQTLGLIYAPFHPQNYFYVDSVLGSVTFEKTLID